MLLSVSPVKYNNLSKSYSAFGKSRNTNSDYLADARKMLYAQLENLNSTIALYDRFCRLNTEIESLKIQYVKETDENKKLSLAKMIKEKINELNRLKEQLEEMKG